MKPGRAYCLIRQDKNMFREGLLNAGYSLVEHIPTDLRWNDIIVVWNRRPSQETEIRCFEDAGAQVLVAENGYIGTDAQGKQLYAMARMHHLGRGKWRIGTPDRWQTQNIYVSPWRYGGDEIVVLAQRSIGELGVAMPRDWPEKIVAKLRSITSKPVRVRKHPGKNPPEISLEDDLKRAHAVVTWGSGAAIKAICAGVPCFHCLPGWIGEDGSCDNLGMIDTPVRPDRVRMLEKLAWSQWSGEEIRSGAAFHALYQ